MTDPTNLMISVSGIRGRVGFGLSPEVVARYAAAFGAWALKQKRGTAVVLGRDSRVSGPLFHQVARATLESVGADVIDLGITTTPTLQMAVEHHHVAGGLNITASHNPIEWNALKFIGHDGLFLNAADNAAMRALIDDIPYATYDKLGVTRFDGDAIARHLDAVLALPMINVAAIRARKFRVAYDACRGAGGLIIPRLLDLLGCDVEGIELDALVKRTRADIGFATDPDVDRLSLVDEKGRAIGEDYTLALASRVVLTHRRGVLVTNLSTSLVVDDQAADHGSVVVRAPVGEVNVALAMRAEGAVVGGEGNGGVILPDLHLGRDAPLGVALILQMLVNAGESLSAVVARYPSYTIIKDKLDRPAAPLDAVYAALRDAFPDAAIDTQDGLRLGWPGRWVHIRPSGTEPIVRVIAEAGTEAAARTLVERARELMAQLAR